MRLLHYLTSGQTSRTQWLETIIMTLILPALGYLADHTDPFFVKASFPWIWFGALLVALRYGIAPALTSVSITALLWLVCSLSGLVAGNFPLNFMLGGALLALVAGQFSSVWSTRLRRSDQFFRHAADRFQQISSAYFMVRLSHDRLEQNLISRPVTLRQAMLEIRKLLIEDGGILGKKTSQEILTILAHYCSLGSAAFYPVVKGKVQSEPLAQCGKGARLELDDLLLQSALENETIAYQAANRLSENQHSSYLVAAPMRTSTGTMLGVLLVTDMPFMALHRETLQILGVLLAYSADHAEATIAAWQLLTIHPDATPFFLAELVKMIRLRRNLNIDSSLVVVTLQPGPKMNEICVALERQQRGLDHTWRRDLGWGVQFVTLMPFSAAAAVEGYQMRLEDMLKNQFNLSIATACITIRFMPVSAEEPIMQLATLLAEDAA